MDVDPMEAVPDDDDEQDERDERHAEEMQKEKRKSRLNSWVAITVALLATFMGICKVKDDNIVQAMQQAQAKAVDDWSWYQARNIRAEVAQATADQIRLQSLSQPGAVRPAYEKQAAAYVKRAAER